MRIRINGDHRDTEARTISELIVELELEKESVVVEHNKSIIPHGQWGITSLEQGDALELLNFVGGG